MKDMLMIEKKIVEAPSASFFPVKSNKQLNPNDNIGSTDNIIFLIPCSFSVWTQ